jgi:hypothetical protein
MADIDVVPKSRSYTWLWALLAIVVVALIVWAFAGRTHAAAELLAPQRSVPTLAIGLLNTAG